MHFYGKERTQGMFPMLAFLDRGCAQELFCIGVMRSYMTVTAQGDQIVFGIFPGMTPKVLMMNLETL